MTSIHLKTEKPQDNVKKKEEEVEEQGEDGERKERRWTHERKKKTDYGSIYVNFINRQIKTGKT